MKKATAILLICMSLMSACLLPGCSNGRHTVVYDVQGGTLLYGETVQHVLDGDNAIAPDVEMEGYTLSWEGCSTDITSDRLITAVWTRTVLSGNELKRLAARRTVELCTDTLKGGKVCGYGFVSGSDGTVVTPAENIELATEMSVTYAGRTYPVSDVISDGENDGIAVLRFDAGETEFFNTAAPSPDEKTYSGRTGTERGLPLINCYGEVTGITSGEGEILRLSSISADNAICMSADEYAQKCIKKLAAYYESLPGEFYYPTALRTYGAVTGESIMMSYSEETTEYVTEYDEQKDWFAYAYSPEEFDEYTGYLTFKGFSLFSESEKSGTRRVSYYNEESGLFIRFMIMDEKTVALNVTRI